MCETERGRVRDGAKQMDEVGEIPIKTNSCECSECQSSVCLPVSSPSSLNTLHHVMHTIMPLRELNL